LVVFWQRVQAHRKGAEPPDASSLRGVPRGVSGGQLRMPPNNMQSDKPFSTREVEQGHEVSQLGRNLPI
jgi:hypothetical protein